MPLPRRAALALVVVALAHPAFAQLKLTPGILGGPTAPAAPAKSPAAPAAPAAEPAATAAPAAPAGQVELEAAGQLAAQGWLTLLDRRDWGRAWESSAGMFRNSVPLGAWMDGIPKVRDPLGALAERDPGEAVYKSVLPGRPAGDYVTVGFDSKFQNRTVQELVTVVREADGRWRVTGYQTR